MKILSAENIRKLDVCTIKNKSINSIDLMEKASKVFTKFFVKKYHNKNKIAIFCGIGNNGGDGLAVSRFLINKGYKVKTYIIEFNENYSEDFKVNFKRLKNTPNNQIDLIKGSKKIDFTSFDLVIDAIWGSGISRPILGFTKDVVKQINASKLPIISIDIPSGLSCDKLIKGEKIEATSTLSFELIKLSFLLPENKKYVGKWYFKSIGLSKTFIQNCDTSFFYTDKKIAKDFIKSRNQFSHKGTNGNSLIIAGKIGSIGAAVLASKACIAIGSGLANVHIPKCGIEIVQISVPEAMVILDKNHEIVSDIKVPTKTNAIGIGPGLGQSKETILAFARFLKSVHFPLVIDADALNILSENLELLADVPKNSILTPHPKEFERLVGRWENDYDKLEKLMDFSKKYQFIVVLKGAYTAIAVPSGKVFFNSTGNPALATGGSGDVLTGIITGFIAQNYKPNEAAILGVYLHGLAADLHQEKTNSERMIASDIIAFLGKAVEKLLKK